MNKEADAERAIETAVSLKEQGNAAFKEGDYKQAMTAYHQIFMYVHGYSQSSGGGGIGLPGTTSPVSSEKMAAIKELKLVHFNNLAMCLMKVDPPNIAKAKDNCTKALELDPINVKALFRRGKCHAQLNALDEAKRDLERVLELQPDNKAAAHELRGLKGAFAALRKKEQKKFAGMFDRMRADAQEEEATSSSSTTMGAAEGGGESCPAVECSEGSSSSDCAKGASDLNPSCNPSAADGGTGKPIAMADEGIGVPQEFEPCDVNYLAR